MNSQVNKVIKDIVMIVFTNTDDILPSKAVIPDYVDSELLFAKSSC